MKFLKHFFLKLSTTMFIFVLTASTLYAQVRIDICNPSDGRICNPIAGNDTITEFLISILEGAIKIGIPIIVLAIIYCGFLFVKARGNPEELSKAKSAFLYTLIGAAILLGSIAIAELIQSTVTALD